MQNKTSITAVDSGVVTYRMFRSQSKEYLKPEWGVFYSNRNISDNPLYC
jgi:hypothetical protein